MNLTSESTNLHTASRSRLVLSIDRYSIPPSPPSLLSPQREVPFSFPSLLPFPSSRRNQGAGGKMVCGVQTRASVWYDTDSGPPSPAGSAREHGAALPSRQSVAALPQNSVPDAPFVRQRTGPGHMVPSENPQANHWGVVLRTCWAMFRISGAAKKKAMLSF